MKNPMSETGVVYLSIPYVAQNRGTFILMDMLNAITPNTGEQ